MIKLYQNNMDTLLQNIKISILEDTFWEDKLIPFLYPGRPKKFSGEVIILREIFNMIQWQVWANEISSYREGWHRRELGIMCT